MDSTHLNSSPSQSLEHHPVYYLDDGNIHLVLEGRILFRVYRGHLARHSQIFLDMVSIAPSRAKAPSPGRHGRITEDQEYLDGIPLVRLDDRADDFAYLLDVVLEITPAYPSFGMLEGVLRIATKYMFDGVREWAVEHLRDRLPTKVENLLADPSLDVYGDRTLAARVISLAREFDLHELLPLALYSIVSHNFSEPPVPSSPLFSPQSSPAVTTSPLLVPHHVSPSSITALGTIHGTLPPADLCRWTIGRQRLSEAAISYLFQLREYGLMKISCSRKVGLYQRTCAAGNVHAVWGRPQPAMAEFIRNPLGVMAIEGKSFDYSMMCGECNAAGQAKHIELVSELFGRLPEILMLSDTSFESS